MRNHVLSAVLCCLMCHVASSGSSDEAVAWLDIGGRRELFVDDFMIASLEGGIRHVVQEPEPQEVVLVTGESWEGNTSAYYSIFQDGDLYRMYYRGSHTDEKMKSLHPEVTCYAESRDGVHWTKPKLGIYEWEGSDDNNIILMGLGSHCFVAFRDDSPACPLEAKYKGISRGRPDGERGLYVFQSPDGIHWELMVDHPVITEGAFDSQNLAFWDPVTMKYVEYHRVFVDGVRSIMTGTSENFIDWSDPVLLKFPEAPPQHLYTNAVQPYFRAPHIRIGFPTRYIPEGSKVEPLFMASRDGVTFKRWPEPVIPRTAPKDRDGNRSNYMAHGLVSLPGDSKHLSVYGTEAYYAGPDSRLRRFEYRVDGFVSLRADEQGGTLTTKPFVFQGDSLRMNYVTDANGSICVALLDEAGSPLPGFAIPDCNPMTGDEIDGEVSWSGGGSLDQLIGKPVQMQVLARNADLYSFQFRSHDAPTVPDGN